MIPTPELTDVATPKGEQKNKQKNGIESKHL